MAEEWNDEKLFDLADYAELDMDAYYEYEQSIISSDDNAVSRDLSLDPGDHTAYKVDQGSFSPTTLRPYEEPWGTDPQPQDPESHTPPLSQLGAPEVEKDI